MGRRTAVTALVALMIGASGCGDDETSNEAQADQRPLFGKCSSGEAAGVDGLTCEEANTVLADWPRGGHPDPATQKLCRRSTAGHDHRADPGVSCASVDDFVAHDFGPHPPGWVERRAGVTCRIDGGETGLLVTCRRGDDWFAFSFS